jgi:murein L,D-transpeptidase YafK
MDRAAPILIRIYKEESTLEVWKLDRTGKFALLSAYPICKYSGHLGPKIFEGDHQAPEGFYDITPGYIITIADDNRAPLDKLCKKLNAASATCDVLRNSRGD